MPYCMHTCILRLWHRMSMISHVCTVVIIHLLWLWIYIKKASSVWLASTKSLFLYVYCIHSWLVFCRWQDLNHGVRYYFLCLNGNEDHRATVIICFSVSDIEEPPPDFKGEVDLEDFWSSVEREILCRGFLKSKFTFVFSTLFCCNSREYEPSGAVRHSACHLLCCLFPVFLQKCISQLQLTTWLNVSLNVLIV